MVADAKRVRVAAEARAAGMQHVQWPRRDQRLRRRRLRATRLIRARTAPLAGAVRTPQ